MCLVRCILLITLNKGTGYGFHAFLTCILLLLLLIQCKISCTWRRCGRCGWCGVSWHRQKPLNSAIVLLVSKEEILRSILLAVCFYPRDAMLARVIEIVTCLSVRPSVTRRYCVKTTKASGMISSPSGSPKTPVFRRQISSPNSKGFPPQRGLKQGSVGKIQRFFSFKRLSRKR